MRTAQRIARALTKLHRGGPPPIRRHTLADELGLLHKRLPQVGERHPGFAPRIKRVLAACDRLAASLPPARLRPLHRDFYPDNVLVADARLYLLDLDLYALGDPALDAGNFIAHLIEQGLREHGDPNALAGPALAFEDTFVGLTGVQSRLAVWAYASLSLARHLFISTRIPERRSLTPALLDLCEQRLLGASVLPQPAEV